MKSGFVTGTGYAALFKPQIMSKASNPHDVQYSRGEKVNMTPKKDIAASYHR